jgi:hypothetical protein
MGWLTESGDAFFRASARWTSASQVQFEVLDYSFGFLGEDETHFSAAPYVSIAWGERVW